AIGTGVAISLAEHTNRAALPAALLVTANGLTVSATGAVTGVDDTSTVTADASAGAAGGVSVAGSVAISIVDHATTADVRGPVTLTGGDLLIEAGSNLTVAANARPVGAGSTATGSVGVGVAFALA